MKRAFTLIEMLVVIAVIALLASIMVPVVGKAIERAHATTCRSNLRQIGISLNGYAAENRGQYPLCSYNEFRGGPFGMVGILKDHLPFGTLLDGSGQPTEWVDSRYTCPLYRKRNLAYGAKALGYGSYAYRHAFQGTDPDPKDDQPPVLNSGATLGGRSITDLRGDPKAGAWSVFHWNPQQYGVVWDHGWTSHPAASSPHDYNGLAAHPPHFHVLFLDGHVEAHLWVHRGGPIPNNQSPNVPPEFRSDAYALSP